MAFFIDKGQETKFLEEGKKVKWIKSEHNMLQNILKLLSSLLSIK